ncbi:MAG: TIM barrel protein [Opitutaceae bacterium]|nr:TIM barrel protein [Opitutaceae bacterium]
MNRREFLRFSAGAAAVASRGRAAEAHPLSLAGEIGITTGSFMRHLSPERAPGKLRLLDLPRIMRDELGMKVIDLMTATLVSLEPAYLDRLRSAAADAGCVLTNLKINFAQADLGANDPATRARAVVEVKGAFDAAARLGARWVRPLPGTKRADLPAIAASYRELADYGAARGLTVLVENIGWMKEDADGVPDLIRASDPRIRAQPDTGNWADATRYTGLAQAFPLAASCDFKAFELGPAGSHAAYDLRRCFQIGWDAGFRGPWAIEHFHADLAQLLRQMGTIRDLLLRWTREQAAR